MLPYAVCVIEREEGTRCGVCVGKEGIASNLTMLLFFTRWRFAVVFALLIAVLLLTFSNIRSTNTVHPNIGDYMDFPSCDQAPQIIVNTDNQTSLLNRTTINDFEKLRAEASTLRLENQKLKEDTVNIHQRLQTVSADSRLSDGRIMRSKIGIPVGIVEDDFSSGKSCKGMGQWWECRDCAANGGPWEVCPPMVPHSPCQPWPTKPMDVPRPRLSTGQNQHAREDGLRYILERHGFRGAYEQYPCLELHDCFNMTKCAGPGPLKVYMYPQYGLYSKPFEDAFATQLTEVVAVNDPTEACLLVVTDRAFGKKDYAKLLASPHWNEGQNHFMFRSHWILNFDWDVFPGAENFQKAAISNANIYQGQLRLGYDIPLYYDHPQKPFSVNDTIYNEVRNLPHRPRSLLLSFQGTIKFHSSWVYHRWLATAYWPQNDTDVLLHVRCPNDNISDPIALTKAPQYDYLSALMNSTFVFCPGGRSPGSWRFGESLAMGAIPVVTTDFLPPFYPEVNWTGCLVRVSEARVIDVPNILRRIGAEEIRSRQTRCRELFEGLIGWMPCSPDRKCKGGLTRSVDVLQTEFVASMKLWNLRIKSYFEQLGHRQKLEFDLGIKK